MQDEPLIDAIDRFLRAVPMADAAFGRRCAGQPSLLHEMRKRGRTLGPKLDAQVRAYIAGEVERFKREYP
jgi:hypothetical protein